MRQKLILTCLGLVALLPSLAGCSMQTPTQPDAPAAIGPTTTITAASSTTSSSRPPFVFPEGCCYYKDMVVRTVVPPANNPNAGRDNFYAITNGVSGQKGVVGVAPGDQAHHGGHWKFYAVTFTVAPYILTSEAAVLAAAAASDVTIARDSSADFRCPIQP
jgi:hypothetical protein